jgi:hypothetical protein
MSARSRCCAIENRRSYGIFWSEDIASGPKREKEKKNYRKARLRYAKERAPLPLCVLNDRKKGKQERNCKWKGMKKDGNKVSTKMTRRQGAEAHARPGPGRFFCLLVAIVGWAATAVWKKKITRRTCGPQPTAAFRPFFGRSLAVRPTRNALTLAERYVCPSAVLCSFRSPSSIGVV